MSNQKPKVIAGITGIIALGAIGFITCTTQIDRGHVGVVFDQFNGGVQEKVLSSGRQFKMPWQRVSEFPTVTKTVYMSADSREGSEENESIKVKASDSILTADLTFSYSFNPDNVVGVQKKYMQDADYIVDVMLRGKIRGWVSEATSKFTTMEIHQSNTEKVNMAVTEHVKKKAQEFGVAIEDVILSETKPSEDMMGAIEARLLAEQNRKTKEDELKTIEIEKDKAKLEAEKKAIEAEGERKANEIKAQGLDPRILEQLKIEKWNGQLPTVTDGQAIVNLK